MFNHSCRPCVTWCMLPSGKVQFVCSKDVPKGKPLCIPYVPEHTPKHRESLDPKSTCMHPCTLRPLTCNVGPLILTSATTHVPRPSNVKHTLECCGEQWDSQLLTLSFICSLKGFRV